MELHQLRVLLAVIETGSILKASKQLNSSRGAVREALQALEAQVGSPLLTRGARGSTPTEAGLALAEGGRALLHSADALLDRVKEEQAGLNGMLRLGCTLGLPPLAVASFLGLLRVRVPDLTLHHGVCADPAQGVDDFDWLLVVGEVELPGSLRTFVIDRPVVGLLAHPDYLARHAPITTLADLDDHALILWSPWGEPEQTLPLVGGGARPVQAAIVTTDSKVARVCANRGLGICLVPDSPVGRAVDDDGLVSVLPDLVGLSIQARVVISESGAGRGRTRASLALLRQVFGDPDRLQAALEGGQNGTS